MFGLTLDHGDEELVLGPEVGVHGRLAHPGRGGHRLHRRRTEALLQEQRPRRRAGEAAVRRARWGDDRGVRQRPRRQPARADQPNELAVRTALRLDAREPYLDHHRPGVLPLLGTAMGVALLSRIAVPLLDEADADTEPGRNLVISDVRIGPALQVAGSGAEVAVSATTSVEIGGPMVHVELSSAIEAPAVVHYQAAFASERSAPAHRSGRGAIRDGDTVDADHIYELFFHGPAFRVLAAAGLAGGAMVARASAVPALTRQPAPVDPVDPVLVELAMQTAGLLEVATRRRMMIPASIARVEYDRRPRRSTPSSPHERPESAPVTRSISTCSPTPGVASRSSATPPDRSPFPLRAAASNASPTSSPVEPPIARGRRPGRTAGATDRNGTFPGQRRTTPNVS